MSAYDSVPWFSGSLILGAYAYTERVRACVCCVCVVCAGVHDREKDREVVREKERSDTISEHREFIQTESLFPPFLRLSAW